MKSDTSSTAAENWLALSPFPDERAANDPITRLIYAGSRTDESYAPMVKMDFRVTIRSGLAMVAMTRTYVNKLDEPIEAIMSIPVPVQAAFFNLSAVIGGKRYEAQAKSKRQARDDYEEAIDEGKAAVLHEELLRGIHSLSVGNLGAGQVAEVTSHWAEPLRFFEGIGQLRIPLTVGDVYGISPLEDVDTLETGGPVPQATLRIDHDAGGIELTSGILQPEDGGGLFAQVPSNAPIEIRMLKPKVAALTGHTADARQVELQIVPEAAATERLNAAILVDRSGSMYSGCERSGASQESKHAAVVRGLREVLPHLHSQDRLALWEFDTSCDRVGRSEGLEHLAAFARSVSQLRQPSGGTAIGHSLRTVMQAHAGADILLITDGQSYQLDVQALARCGHRVFVVLVGEDSLEAKVGHLAALTGGDVQFSYGTDVGMALRACIQGMRQQRATEPLCRMDENNQPVKVRTSRSNAAIKALWSSGTGSEETGSGFARAVAAYAASLAFAGAGEEQAEAIAIAEGLVTHLTSLILIATEGPAQKDLPRTIKQPIAAPRRAVTGNQGRVYAALPSDPGLRSARAMPLGAPLDPVMPLSSYTPGACYLREPRWLDWENLEWLGAMIDWNANAAGLAKGELHGLPSDIQMMIQELACELDDLADELSTEAELLVIALAALAASKESRQAARVYRRLTASVDGDRLDEYADSLGHQA
ncbi:MAG: VIT domain-containing protein [Bacteroidota bacterium]|nr:VIT domain-containing protein [Bacteroidota bacterium]